MKTQRKNLHFIYTLTPEGAKFMTGFMPSQQVEGVYIFKGAPLTKRVETVVYRGAPHSVEVLTKKRRVISAA